jgi:small subunit ribosomal protein S9
MTTAASPYVWGTGRRKTAVARVRIKEGTGKFLIKCGDGSAELDVDAYFPLEIQRTDVRAPLVITEMAGRVDVFVNIKGSGKHSQSGAVLLGLARALKEYRPDTEPALRDAGFLTRDARKVERKKYGHKKARKSFQFSKR